MCFNTIKCQRTHLGEKTNLCVRIRIWLWKQLWVQGMKSGWIAECSAQKCNYIFSICIYVSMLCTAYQCTDISLSTVVITNRRTTTKSAQASQTCETIADPNYVADGETQLCVGVNYFHINVIQSQWPIFTQLAQLQKVCTKVKVWHFKTEWLCLLSSSENYNK